MNWQIFQVQFFFSYLSFHILCQLLKIQKNSNILILILLGSFMYKLLKKQLNQSFILLKRRKHKMSVFQESSVLTEVKSNKIILPSSQEIQTQLEQKINQMSGFQKTGNYVKASKCKQNIEQLKKQLHQKKMQDMMLRHKKQRRKMEKSQQQQVSQLTIFWDKKLQQFKSEAQNLRQELQIKHEGQISNAKIQLETQIPNKVKQSSECLNLRKIQEQMAKQKKYTQAHKVQMKVLELQKKQKQNFEKQRQAKMQAALSQLRNKQKAQKQALTKRMKAGQTQLTNDKNTELDRVKHKNLNSLKQMKSQQQKQLLSHKGQIKNKVTVSKITSRSKLVPSQIN